MTRLFGRGLRLALLASSLMAANTAFARADPPLSTVNGFRLGDAGVLCTAQIRSAAQAVQRNAAHTDEPYRARMPSDHASAVALGRTRGPSSPRSEQESRCTALFGQPAKPEIERIEHAGRQITGIR